MKVNKFTAKSVVDSLECAGGIIAGSMLSNGVTEALPVPADKKTLAKGGVALAGVAMASLIGGNDTLAKAARNACIGMAVQQGREIVEEVVAPYLPEPNGEYANKFLHDVMGSKKTAVTTSAAPAPAMGSAAIGGRFLANPAAPVHVDPSWATA